MDRCGQNMYYIWNIFDYTIRFIFNMDASDVCAFFPKKCLVKNRVITLYMYF